MILASSDTITGLVGGLGTLAGVVVGGFITLKVARESQRGTKRTELARALAGYMQATQLVAFEMSSMPKSTWLERQIDRVPTGRIHFFINRLLARMIFGQRHDELRERYYRASAEVVLIAPIEMIGLVREIDAFSLIGNEIPTQTVCDADGLIWASDCVLRLRAHLMRVGVDLIVRESLD